MPKAKAMLSARSLRRELLKVGRLVRDNRLDEHEHAWMVGAQQALAWALRDNAAAPHSIIPAKKKGGR